MRLREVAGSIVRRIRHLPAWLWSCNAAVLMEVPTPASTATVLGYEVREALIADLPDLAQCRVMSDPAKGIQLFANRIELGMHCHMISDSQGMVVGYAWSSTTENLLEDADRYVIHLGTTGIYLFDTYLHPMARGKDLYRMLIGWIQHHWQERNREHTFVMVDTTNTRSLKAHAKLGAVECERMKFASLLGITVHIVRCQKKTIVHLGLFGSKHTVSSLHLPGTDASTVSVEVDYLDTEFAWDRFLPELKELDDTALTYNNPLLAGEAIHVWWKHDIKDRWPAVLVRIHANGKAPDTRELLGYGVFRLYTDTERFLKPRVLEAFHDLYFMDNRILIRHGNLTAREVLQILETRKNRRYLRKKTKADVLVWHRLPQSEFLDQQPSIRHATISASHIEYPLLETKQNHDLSSHPMYIHALHDIQKQKKRLRNATGSDPVVQHIQMASLSSGERVALANRLTSIMQRSWQHQWMQEQGGVDVPLYERKLKDYMEVWSNMGTLHVHLLQIGGNDAGYLVSVWDRQACRCLLIGYDKACKTYSPGKMVFVALLEDSTACNIHHFHLGGNVVGWKEEWMTRLSHLSNLDIWLGSITAQVHRAKETAKMIRRRTGSARTRPTQPEP